MTNLTVTTRELRSSDAAELAAVHVATFPSFFLTSLGPRFLRRYYRAMACDSQSVAVVALIGDTIVGAAVGTTEPEATYRRMLRRQGLQFAIVAIPAIARSPYVWRRLARAARYRGQATGRPRHAALLSSLLVDPRHAGCGIGSAALRAWEREVAASRMAIAYATTDAKDNESALRFYSRRGWAPVAHFTTAEGRPMLTLKKTLL